MKFSRSIFFVFSVLSAQSAFAQNSLTDFSRPGGLNTSMQEVDLSTTLKLENGSASNFLGQSSVVFKKSSEECTFEFRRTHSPEDQKTNEAGYRANQYTLEITPPSVVQYSNLQAVKALSIVDFVASVVIHKRGKILGNGKLACRLPKDKTQADLNAAITKFGLPPVQLRTQYYEKVDAPRVGRGVASEE